MLYRVMKGGKTVASGLPQKQAGNFAANVGGVAKPMGAAKNPARKKTPSGRFWLVEQGSSRARVRAPDMESAKRRAAEIGFKSPDSIALDDGVTEARAARKNPTRKAIRQTTVKRANPSSDTPGDFSQSTAKVYGRAWSDAKQATAKDVGGECVVRLTWNDGEWLQMVFDTRAAAMKTLHRLGFKE